IAERKGQEVGADTFRRRREEAREDERVREEDRVVEERLRDHERQPEHSARAIASKHDARDRPEADHLPHHDAKLLAGPWRRGAAGVYARPDRADYLVGLGDATVKHEPSRTLGNVAPHQDDRSAEKRA